MKRSSQFFGASGGLLKVPTSVKALRVSGYVDASALVAANTADWTNAGAMTANTYKTAISLTGAGDVAFFAVKTNDTTSRSISVRVTLDGVDVREIGPVAVATIAGLALVPIGAIAGAVPVMRPVPYTSSCLIEIKSSLSETDKLAYASDYRVG